MASVVLHARSSLLDQLNRDWHVRALIVFTAIVVGHLAEHLVQAFQIAVLGWARPAARGVLGVPFPWLISSEVLHYGYALLMLAGLVLLRPGFRTHPAALTFWSIALWIQVWHHLEHLSLIYQAWSGNFFLVPGVATSFLQMIPGVQRVELHFAYNLIVAVPMAIAMWLYTRQPGDESLADTTAAGRASS
jgi:hypothetical protein